MLGIETKVHINVNMQNSITIHRNIVAYKKRAEEEHLECHKSNVGSIFIWLELLLNSRYLSYEKESLSFKKTTDNLYSPDTTITKFCICIFIMLRLYLNIFHSLISLLLVNDILTAKLL